MDNTGSWGGGGNDVNNDVLMYKTVKVIKIKV